MKNKIEEVLAIQKFGNELGGVLVFSDLKTLLYDKSIFHISKLLSELELAGAFKRFIRGFYYMPDKNIDLALISQRIAPESYISFECILAKELIIGVTPKFAVSAVKIGPAKTYKDEKYRIAQYGIKPELFFGYEKKDGIAYATKEKAILDILYFYSLGSYKPLINIYADIDYSRFDKKKLRGYLSKYKNPKFKKFVNSLLEE